jgi:hypothetical protein
MIDQEDRLLLGELRVKLLLESPDAIVVAFTPVGDITRGIWVMDSFAFGKDRNSLKCLEVERPARYKLVSVRSRQWQEWELTLNRSHLAYLGYCCATEAQHFGECRRSPSTACQRTDQKGMALRGSIDGKADQFGRAPPEALCWALSTW